MTLEERVAQLEKDMAELKGQISAQPELSLQNDEKLISVIVRTNKRKYMVEAD